MKRVGLIGWRGMVGSVLMQRMLEERDFDLIEPAIRQFGYNVEVLRNDDRSAIDTGLKYVNNDACYPSLIVVGQIMNAVLSGKYDMTKTAILISQTGGGCRATNYIGFIRRALAKAGYPEIPVISLNLSGLEANPGFRLTPELVIKSMYGLAFGDIFLRVLYRMRPYEKVPGSADALHEKWKQACRDFVSQKHVSRRRFARICREIVEFGTNFVFLHTDTVSHILQTFSGNGRPPRKYRLPRA